MTLVTTTAGASIGWRRLFFLPGTPGQVPHKTMSKTFLDTTGHPWSISITVRDVKRVRDMVGINLYGILDDQLRGFAELIEDPITLIDVVYVLCQDQADALPITDEDFGRRFAGDTIESAAGAFMEAFRDFCPSPRQRAAISKLIEAWGKIGVKMGALVETRLAQLDIDKELDRYLNESSVTSGDSPASSASTPAP